MPDKIHHVRVTSDKLLGDLHNINDILQVNEVFAVWCMEQGTCEYSDATGKPILAPWEPPHPLGPVFVSAEVPALYNDTIEIAFSGDPDGTIAGFSVTVDGVAVVIANIFIISSTITMILAAPVTAGQVILFSYDAATGDMASDTDPLSFTPSFTDEVVDNKLVAAPVVLPTLATAAIETVTPADVALTFSEGVTGTGTGFTAKVDGTVAPASGIVVAGDKVTLTLVTPVTAGQVVTVSYDAATGDLASTATPANMVATVTDSPVANNLVAAPPAGVPTLATAGIAAPYTIDLKFSEAITGTGLGFTARVDGSAITVSGAVVVGDTATLTLAVPVTFGQVVTASYDAAVGDLASDATPANQVAAFTNTPVTNALAAPVGSLPLPGLANVDAATPRVVNLAFTHPISGTGAGLEVRIDGVVSGLSAFSIINGHIASVTTTFAITAGQVVTISYDASIGNLMDATPPPSAVASFPARPVTNNVV